MSIFSGGNWLLSLKVFLWSTGVLSVAVLLKLSVPLLVEFVICGVPILYSSVVSWLRPPYLYILINFIIISILASSRLQQSSDEDRESPPPQIVSPPPSTKDSAVLNDSISSDFRFLIADPKLDYIFAAKPEHVHVQPLEEVRTPESPERERSFEAMNGRDISSKEERDSSPLLPKNDSIDIFSSYSDKENEKPPVSSRFAHRKALKSSPEGNVLRVSKPKRQDTLESTWRTITEGRAMPLTRHLKKSDTVDPYARRILGQTDPNPGPVMKKSGTFHERTNSPSPGSGKPRREASLSQDELNRRVEAFIKKFNEEMRLQREESLNQYQEMVAR